MHAGIPLDDEDRAPWLRAVAARIDEWRERGEAGVITCSALKRKYRDMIVGDRPEVRLVYLTAAAGADRRAPRRAARPFHAGQSARKPARRRSNRLTPTRTR